MGDMVDEDIIASIDEDMFKINPDLDGFNSIEYVLNKFPSDLGIDLDSDYILKEKTRLEKQLSAVSRKLSRSILDKEKAYGEELERVMSIQTKLKEAISVCDRARKGFYKGKKNFTCAALGLVASYKRREVLRDLLRSLSTIKTLQETNSRVKELIENNHDYFAAIQLCIECQKVVNSLQHYKCVRELGSKPQDMLEMTEEHIDSTLSKMCLHFNKSVYQGLQKAYQLLGKTQTSMDSLSMHFATAISDKAFSVVHGYVELCSQENLRSENFRKKEYKELCKYVTGECFIPCLIDLNKALWNILVNYKRILHYHQTEDEKDIEDNDNKNKRDSKSGINSGDNVTLEDNESEEVESSFNKRFVKQKLEHGLVRIWQEIQQKLRILIQSHDMSQYTLEKVIIILKISRRMIEIGQEFCGDDSVELEETLHNRAVHYFRHYHKIRLDELRMYLENESWEVCPIKSNFQFLDLHEFRFLKSLNSEIKQNLPSSIKPSSQGKCVYFKDAIVNNLNYKGEEPFDNICQENDEYESILKNINDSKRYNCDSSEDELGEDVDKDLANDNGFKSDNNFAQVPFVTNTSLYILKLIGKYMQIMFVLKPIAFDILLSIFHLYDHYFYTVYLFFCKEITEMRNNCLTNKLKTCLMRIEAPKESKDGKDNFELPSPISIRSHALESYTLTSENLYGLTYRITGIESMIYLSSQFVQIQPYLHNLIPPSRYSILDQYYALAVSIAQDLRYPSYMLVAIKSINFESVLNNMDNVKWDIKDIPNLHNPYVDSLLRELQLFSIRLEQIYLDLKVHVPIACKEMIWCLVLKLANRIFIEGFSMAKKCTPAGRASMQLDFQQFLSKILKVHSTKTIPEKELVEEYIKAYYLMDEALEQWIIKRKEYTYKQLLSLINCVVSEKKVKNRLLTIIESKFDQNSNSDLPH